MKPSVRKCGRLRQLAFLTALLLPLVVLSGCSSNSDSNGGDGGQGGDDAFSGSCTEGVDPSIDIDSAITLGENSETMGYICPRRDNDYYAIEVPAGHQLLRINLQLSAPVSQLRLTYLILDEQGAVVGRAPEEQNNLFDALHCLEPGRYVLQVQDEGNDSADLRNSYRLSYNAEQDNDVNEPANDTHTTAPAAQGGQANTGYISCTGDIDFYRVTLATDELLEVGLSNTEATPVDLQYTIYREVGGVLTSVASDGTDDGARAATQLQTLHGLPQAGTYYVAVEDRRSNDSDAAQGYTLQLTPRLEPDNGDRGTRNDHPAAGRGGPATPLGSFSGASCAAPTVFRYTGGLLASKADVDYFRIDGGAGITVDNPAVMDVQLTFSGPTNVDPTVAFLYGHPSSACSSDGCCRVLNGSGSCDRSLDCADSTFTCVSKNELICNDPSCEPTPSSGCSSERRCAGSVTCLPSGLCGAQQFVRRAENGGTVHTAQPMVHAGPWYLRVTDTLSDEWDYATSYTLTVKVCNDPDPGETNNAYFPRLAISPDAPPAVDSDEFSIEEIEDFFSGVGRQRANASGVTIPSTIGGWSGWIVGHISYEHDEDHITIANPCKGVVPNDECLIAAEYEVTGAGCSGAGANGLGFNVNYVLRKGDGGFDFQSNTVPHALRTFGYPSNGCAILLRGRSSATMELIVADLYHNSWSWDCTYRVRFGVVYHGCPVGAGQCAVSEGTCYVP